MRRDLDGGNLITAELFGFKYFGPSYTVFHWTAILVSEVPEWDLDLGGGFSSMVSCVGTV
jgi:hypothetical protein